MRLPAEHSSPDTLLELYSAYHLARLSGDSTCGELLPPFAEAHANLETTIDQHRAARQATMVALAARDGAEASLDNSVRDFSLAVLGRVHNNRNAPVYVEYFPAGTSDITTASLDSKLTRVGSILVKLANEADPVLKSFETPLQGTHDGLRAALQTYHDAFEHQTQCMSVIRAEVVRWTGAYRRSHIDLTRKFLNDPRQADSYFRRPPSGKRGEEEGEETDTAVEPEIQVSAVPGSGPASSAS